jgi:hypothetical protein
MVNSPTINIYFEDKESSYIIKLGQEKHLKEIQNGIIRFKHITYYRELENTKQNSIIDDKFEGMESLVYPMDISYVLFAHPLINNGESLDITDQLNGPIINFPDRKSYISCMTHFTVKDIVNHSIFDDRYLKENEYDSVLFFLDTKGFIKNLEKSLTGCHAVGRPVNYRDYSQSQENLGIFTKSLDYAWQKEVRIVLEEPAVFSDSIKRIDDTTITVIFEKVQCAIIPICEFREGFKVNERYSDNGFMERI